MYIIMQISCQQHQQHLESIYETIDNLYLENIVPFIPHSNNKSVFYCTRSTIVCTDHCQYRQFFTTSPDGYVAVPVTNTISLYFRISSTKKYDKFIDIEVGKDQGLWETQRTNLQQHDRSVQVLYEYKIQTDSTEVQQKHQIVSLLQKSQTKIPKPHFGIILRNQSAVLGNEDEEYIEVQIPSSDSSEPEVTKFVFVSYHNLVYLAGFKHKYCQIRFDSAFKDTLNRTFDHQVEGVLNLGGENIGVDGLKYIANNHSRHLVTLNLWWNMLNQEGAQILSKGYYPQLKFLDLRKNFIGDVGLMHFNVDENCCDYQELLMRCFPNVEKLALTDNNLTTAKHIKPLIFPSLNELQLQNNYLTLNSPSEIQIPVLKTLKILSLRNNRITGQGLSSLILEGLEELYLSQNLIVTCQPLAMAYLPKLVVLCVDKNKISSMRWLNKCLFASSKSKGLKTLDISENQISEISCLSGIDWLQLQDLRVNSSKKISIIKQYDKVSFLNDLCKWNINSIIHSHTNCAKIRKFEIKKSGLNFKKLGQALIKKLEPDTTIIM